jgi:alcohol dehydrogenase (cytochrome c)
MTKRFPSTRHLLLVSVLLAASPALAAEVTPDRLIHADSEPQNWLLNHRAYDGQRYSPLNVINKDNIKGLKLAYAVALGGTTVNENLEAIARSRHDFTPELKNERNQTMLFVFAL